MAEREIFLHSQRSVSCEFTPILNSKIQLVEKCPHKDSSHAVNLRDILFLRFRPRLARRSTAGGFVHALTTQIHA